MLTACTAPSFASSFCYTIKGAGCGVGAAHGRFLVDDGLMMSPPRVPCCDAAPCRDALRRALTFSHLHLKQNASLDFLAAALTVLPGGGE